MVKASFPRQERGFTLIEAVMVIVITGIVASMVAVFIKTSIDSYMSSVSRANLTDMADVTLRRIEREVHLAVPNSLRMTTSGNVTYLEFVPTKDGGRYRNEGDGSSGAGLKNMCTGGSTNASFDVLGPMPSIATGDSVVVYNDASLGSSGSPSNVYGGSGGSRAATTNSASPLTLSAALGNSALICSYANNRFQVVDKNIQAVTYACPNAASDNMTRYWNYGFNAAQVAPPGGTSALVVGNATCTIDYTPNAMQRIGLLYITLTLTSGGESVTAFREIHVDNTP